MHFYYDYGRWADEDVLVLLHGGFLYVELSIRRCGNGTKEMDTTY